MTLLTHVIYFVHQGELRAAKAEASHWQSLYEDLKHSSANLKKSQDLSMEQLHQLQAQLEVHCTAVSYTFIPHYPNMVSAPGLKVTVWFVCVSLSVVKMARCQEAGLLEEVESLQQEGVELLSSMAQLEEDNEDLREEVQYLKGQGGSAHY